MILIESFNFPQFTLNAAEEVIISVIFKSNLYNVIYFSFFNTTKYYQIQFEALWTQIILVWQPSSLIISPITTSRRSGLSTLKKLLKPNQEASSEWSLPVDLSSLNHVLNHILRIRTGPAKEAEVWPFHPRPIILLLSTQTVKGVHALDWLISGDPED